MPASKGARRPFFCGNWKLQGSVNESVALATEVRNGVATLRDVDVVVAPSFTAIHAVARRLEGGPVSVAGQDCFWEDKGAFTGEVSAPQLSDAGCKFVILGHSERRQLMGELDAAVNLKAKAALRAGLAPIVCVGETLAERDAGETLGRVGAQVDAALTDLTAADLARSIVGGSMKPDNVRALMAQADVDGGLIGGASLVAESFVRLVQQGIEG